MSGQSACAPKNIKVYANAKTRCLRRSSERGVRSRALKSIQPSIEAEQKIEVRASKHYFVRYTARNFDPVATDRYRSTQIKTGGAYETNPDVERGDLRFARQRDAYFWRYRAAYTVTGGRQDNFLFRLDGGFRSKSIRSEAADFARHTEAFAGSRVARRRKHFANTEHHAQLDAHDHGGTVHVSRGVLCRSLAGAIESTSQQQSDHSGAASGFRARNRDCHCARKCRTAGIHSLAESAAVFEGRKRNCRRCADRVDARR